jgi:hypothetical protein
MSTQVDCREPEIPQMLTALRPVRPKQLIRIVDRVQSA